MKVVENGRYELDRGLLELTLRFSSEVRVAREQKIFMVISRFDFNLVSQVPSSCEDVQTIRCLTS